MKAEGGIFWDAEERDQPIEQEIWGAIKGDQELRKSLSKHREGGLVECCGLSPPTLPLARMLRVLSTTLYDMNGIIKEDYEILSEWTHIAPNSVTSYLTKILCP